MEEEPIRARSIELVDENGNPSLKLDGGGGEREPGIIIYGPNGTESSIGILVRRENGMPYIMASTAQGTVVQFTFNPDGTPVVNLRDQDGDHRTITP